MWLIHGLVKAHIGSVPALAPATTRIKDHPKQGAFGLWPEHGQQAIAPGLRCHVRCVRFAYGSVRWLRLFYYLLTVILRLFYGYFTVILRLFYGWLRLFYGWFTVVLRLEYGYFTA